MIILKEGPSLVLYLGRQGENGVRTLDFDFSDFRNRFGDGVLSLVIRRKPNEDPFHVALDIIPQNTAVWTVSNVETDIVGEGEAQFIYTVGGNVKKTVIYKTRVDASLTPVSETAPEAFQNWLDELAEIGGQVSADKSLAIEEIDEAKENALHAIGNGLTDATSSIRTEKGNALDAISNSRKSALDAVDAKKEIALHEVGELVSNARDYSQSAKSASDSADGFAKDAERYAQQAQSYAENLHFVDTGTGDIEITIGGTNG